MQVEVEVHRNELGEWVPVAVAWNVQATGQSENEALARLMEALAPLQDFARSERRASLVSASSTAPV